MKIASCLPLLLLMGIAWTPSDAQIFKCRETDGSILYTDAPCSTINAKAIAFMPKDGRQFGPAIQPDAVEMESDAAIQEELTLLSAEEAELNKELDDAQAAPGESLSEMPQAHAMRLEIMAKLEAVRHKKSILLGRGLSTDDHEELEIENDY